MSGIICENLSFQYEGKSDDALKGINLRIRSGEFVLLTGKSGCGKTTLTRCINGQVPHFYKGALQGRVLVDGLDTAKAESYEIAKRIGSVFQDPRSQFFTTNATDEVAFGCENLALPANRIQNNVDEAFSGLGIGVLRGRSLFELSSGERQKIAIASAYAMKPAVFVLDEPSANLDIRSTNMLADILRTLKNQGHTIIISEHRLYYLMALVDRILYMDKGIITDEWTQQQAMRLSSEELMCKGLRSFSMEKLSMSANRSKDAPAGPCRLDVWNVAVNLAGKPVLRQINFCTEKSLGCIIGIAGENGVGKTTLVKTLCGLTKEKAGEIHIAGRRLGKNKRAKETYFVMQDADYQLFTESVADELRFGNKSVPGLEEKIDDTLALLGLAPYKEYHPLALSGGQKQRVTIASAALSPSRVLFFDEPTSGLDGESMRNVSRILIELSQKGKLIFVISHDVEFLVQTCGRIIHIEQGYVTEDFALDKGTISKLKELLLK